MNLGRQAQGTTAFTLRLAMGSRPSSRKLAQSRLDLQDCGAAPFCSW